MIERTLAIIKPDAVSRGLIGAVIQRYEQLGLKVLAMRMIHLTKPQADGFYAVHRQRPFFDELTTFMSSGPSVVLLLEGDEAIKRYRDLMGATDPRQADRGTLRGDFGTDIQHNVVHGSDSPETARFEISYFFNDFK